MKKITFKLSVCLVKPMSETDIELLAMMCRQCAPIIEKGRFIRREYAYYVPKEDSVFAIAKDIFEKNGIKMQKHESMILGNTSTDVLRTNYAIYDNQEELYKIMKKINIVWLRLYEPKNKQKRDLINAQIEQLKQRQK